MIKNEKKAKEDEISSLLGYVIDFIIEIDKDGRILFINRTIPELKIEETIGKSVYKYILPKYHKKYKKIVAKVFQTKQVEYLETQGVGPKGTVSWYRTRFVPIIRDGTAITVMLIATDITDRKKAIETLHASEEKYRELIELSPDSIILLDKNGFITGWNLASEKLTGYSRKEAIGKSFAAVGFFNKQDIPQQMKLFRDLMKGKVSKPFEVQWYCKDRTPKIVEAHIGLIEEKGKITGLQVIARDITERKKVEESLQKSREQLNTIFETANDGIAQLDTNGKILAINKKLEEILGYSRNELLGRKFVDIGKILDPKELPHLLEIMTGIVTAGHSIQNFEMTLTKKDRTLISVEINTNAIREGNKITGITAVIRDITERKKAEEALKTSEEKLRSIFESAKDCILYIDATGKILAANKKTESISGYSLDEVIGKRFNELKAVDRTYIPLFLNILKEAIITGKPTKNIEMILTKKDGKRIPIEVNSGIVEHEGRTTGIIAIIRDITDRKKVEQQLIEYQDELKKSRDKLEEAYYELKSLDRMKDEFVNISAHELKTPLVPIIAYLDLMLKNKKSELGKKEKEKIEICLRNAVRLKNLVTDISDISKLETKTMKFELRPSQIEEIINHVIEDLGPAAKKKKIEIIKTIKPDLPLINIDPEKLEQAISKLVENSIKFTDKGSIKISAEKQPNKILIKIADTGIGIDKKDIPKLFTKFYQADSSPARKAKGTGLGLVICKNIIEEQKGKIRIESPGLGKGTTFFITLPTQEPMIKKDHIVKAKKIIKNLYFEPKK